MASSPNTVIAWVGAVVRAQAHRPALISDGVVWTYQELWNRAASVARDLLGTGLRPGQAVGILGANEPSYIVNYLGIMRAGGTAVPVSNLLDGQTIATQLSFVEAEDVFVGVVDPAVRYHLEGSFRVRPMQSAFRKSSSGRLPNVGSNSPCCVMLTSGTTGQPKGVVHTQGTMLHGALQLASAFPFSVDDRSLVFLPLHACIPEQVLPTLCTGGSLEIHPDFDADRVAEACGRVTTFDAVPTVLSRLIEHVPAENLAKLKWILFASEPMPVPLLERWWSEQPTVELHQFYGMTEMLPLSAAPHSLLRQEPASVGRAFPTTAITLDNRDRQSGVGGEIRGLTPARMAGYLGDSAATSSVIAPDGSMRTGDIGRLDERGLLFLTGRSKDIIISGGINIAPGEIEAYAASHPSVERVIVVGLPSEKWGETPVVVAVPRRGASLTPRELLAHCRSGLSGYKRPTGAGLVDVLPTTGIGKTAKDEVRRKILDGEIDVVRYQ